MNATKIMAATPEVDNEALTAELIRRVDSITTNVRARSREAERIRRLPDETMAEVEAAGLLKLMVPKRFGGHGLGLDGLCRVARHLAHGDASTAWAVSFLIEHNWMLCHLDMGLQKKLLADRSYIRAAASLLPFGQAVKVDGGYQLTGKWGYGSGACNSDWTFVTSFVEEGGKRVSYTFLLPHDQITLHDDWHFTGMAATGSVSVSADNLFVPDDRAIRTDIFHSATLHPGAVHEEPVYRFPLILPLYLMVASIMLGSAESVIELGRERMSESKLFGLLRIEREQSRARWSAARQLVRCADLLWQDVLGRADGKCNREEPWTIEEEGQFGLDMISIGHLCKDAIRMIMDGVGSSAFNLDNPLPRYMRDVDVMVSWPGMDWDIVSERGTRWILGMGRSPTDPFPPAEQ
jgi:alkylation response protein AidB-like acyl-CoA dehydrogenase